MICANTHVNVTVNVNVSCPLPTILLPSRHQHRGRELASLEMLSALRSQITRTSSRSAPQLICQRNLLRYISTTTRLYSSRCTTSSASVLSKSSSSRLTVEALAPPRHFGHLAGRDEPPKQDKKPDAGKDAQKTAKDLGSEVNVSLSDQRKKDWAIIKRLMANVWPPGDWSVRSRVMLGFGLLVAGKVFIARRGYNFVII